MSAVQAFLSYLQVERRMSAHTLDAYQRDLAALTQWCEAHDVADRVAAEPCRRGEQGQR